MEAISWEAVERRDWREDEEGSGQPVLGGSAVGSGPRCSFPGGWGFPQVLLVLGAAHLAAARTGAADIVSCFL